MVPSPFVSGTEEPQLFVSQVIEVPGPIEEEVVEVIGPTLSLPVQNVDDNQ
jgi:hypothetical protein